LFIVLVSARCLENLVKAFEEHTGVVTIKTEGRADFPNVAVKPGCANQNIEVAHGIDAVDGCLFVWRAEVSASQP
jgi:hypothetical protein